MLSFCLMQGLKINLFDQNHSNYLVCPRQVLQPLFFPFSAQLSMLFCQNCYEIDGIVEVLKFLCFLQIDWKQKKLVYFIVMAQTKQQIQRSLIRRQLKILVSEYIDSLSASLMFNKKNSCHHQSTFDQYQQTKQETATDLGSSIQVNHQYTSEKMNSFSRTHKSRKKESLKNIQQIEKQHEFFANFEENNSTIQQSPSRIEIAQKSSFNFGSTAHDRKFGKSQEQEYEHSKSNLVKVIKKNIRVHNNRVNNKSTQNLNRQTMSKQHRYNELRDKTLVQYFYPRQKKIFKENIVNSNNVSKKQNDLSSEKPTQSKNIKKCESQRKENVTILLKKRKEGSYKTKNQCGRKINFNNYDLVSCNFSLKKFGNDRTLNMKANQRQSQKGQQPDQKLLKVRMKNMEQQVYRKMPFLVQMGVKFKTTRVKP